MVKFLLRNDTVLSTLKDENPCTKQKHPCTPLYGPVWRELAAAARSTAAVWLRHVTTWLTTRRPGRPRLGKTLRDADFRRLPLLKGHSSTPSLQFLINVGHRQQAVFPPTRTSQWHFGDWGRAGRGTGEPAPASGATSLAGSPPRGPR